MSLAASAWRWLVLLHRWAGVVLCLMFVAWFASGLCIIYVKFPELTAAERRTGSAPIDIDSIRIAPGAAVGKLRAGDFNTVADGLQVRQLPVADPQAHLLEVSSVRLGMLFERPMYRVDVPGRQPRVVFADTGEVLGPVTAEMALRAAREFAARASMSAAITYHGLVQSDQWSISGSLHAHRPLHHLALADAQGTELYVSSTTGQVVRDTHRTERVLNYFAAVTHWLYPTFLRRYPERWSWTVDILASAGAVLALSGLWIGFARWRRGTISPYRGLMRWHHVTGLVFGLTALTWVFSGLLSMNPANLNPDEAASVEEALVFTGTPLIPSDFAMLRAMPGTQLLEAELLHFDRQPFYRCSDRNGILSLQYAGSDVPRLPSVANLLERASRLMPGATLIDATVLQEFDEYYYTHHGTDGSLPLPVLRLQFGDPERTRFYVDVASGQVLGRSTQRNRVYRWLYNGLHSFDFKWLRERRPLWDIVVLTFCAGGLALAVIGLIAAVRRLRRELRGAVPGGLFREL